MASIRDLSTFIDARPSFVGTRIVQMALLQRANISVLPGVAVELSGSVSDEVCARLADQALERLSARASTRRVALTHSRTGESCVVEASALASEFARAWGTSSGAFLLLEAFPVEDAEERVIEAGTADPTLADLCARVASVAGEPCSVRVLETAGQAFVRHVRGDGANPRRKPLPIRRVAVESLSAAGFVAVARGVPASIGYALGAVSLTPTREAGARANLGQVLFRQTVTRENRDEITTSAALVCPSAGITSHAALFARAMGKPCVVGLSDITVDERKVVLVDRSGQPLSLREGDACLVDGTGGGIYRAPSLEASVPCSYDVPKRAAPAPAGRLALDIVDPSSLADLVLDLPLFVREATAESLKLIEPTESRPVWIRFEPSAGRLAEVASRVESGALAHVVLVARTLDEALAGQSHVRRTGAKLGMMIESPGELSALARAPDAIQAICVGLGDLGQAYTGRSRESAGGAVFGWDISYTEEVTRALRAFRGDVLVAGNAPLLPAFFEALDGIGDVLRAEVPSHVAMAAWVWGVARTAPDPFGPDERI